MLVRVLMLALVCVVYDNVIRAFIPPCIDLHNLISRGNIPHYQMTCVEAVRDHTTTTTTTTIATPTAATTY